MAIKSLVEIKLDKSAYCNPDFSDLQGEPVPDRIYFGYNGNDYAHISGAIGWPPGFGTQSGCVLIIGVTREEVPRFEILDALFCSTAREVMRNCLFLRDKFGFRECSKLFNYWIGDSSRFITIEDDFNSGLDNEKHRCGVYTNSPSDFEKPNADEIFIDQIRNISTEGRLILPDSFHEVRDTLQNMGVSDNKLSDYPAAAALGYALHDCIVTQPWLNVDGRVWNIEE
jgi:hypothetical protein